MNNAYAQTEHVDLNFIPLTTRKTSLHRLTVTPLIQFIKLPPKHIHLYKEEGYRSNRGGGGGGGNKGGGGKKKKGGGGEVLKGHNTQHSDNFGQNFSN